MCVLRYFSHVRLFTTPMDCSPPGSAVHGILWARILEWAAMPFSRVSSQPRNQTPISYVSCTGTRILYQSCHLGNPDLWVGFNKESKWMKTIKQKQTHRYGHQTSGYQRWGGDGMSLIRDGEEEVWSTTYKSQGCNVWNRKHRTIL